MFFQRLFFFSFRLIILYILTVKKIAILSWFPKCASLRNSRLSLLLTAARDVSQKKRVSPSKRIGRRGAKRDGCFRRLKMYYVVLISRLKKYVLD